MSISFIQQSGADYPHVACAGLPGCFMPDIVSTLDNRKLAIDWALEDIEDCLEDSELSDQHILNLREEAEQFLAEFGIWFCKPLNRQWSISIGEEAAELYAIAKLADCPADEVSEARYDYYGLRVFEVGRAEYAIGTDLEADDACAEYIKESLWAFNGDFLSNYCPLDSDGLQLLQEKLHESASDSFLQLVGDQLPALVEAAIGCDGRGHFLASYDGAEEEVVLSDQLFYVYRIN